MTDPEYHFDDSNVVNALGVSSTPGLPSVTPTRAQEFVMSNTKAIGPTAVNESRTNGMARPSRLSLALVESLKVFRTASCSIT